jgi:hypothetical protein
VLGLYKAGCPMSVALKVIFYTGISNQQNQSVSQQRRHEKAANIIGFIRPLACFQCAWVMINLSHVPLMTLIFGLCETPV